MDEKLIKKIHDRVKGVPVVSGRSFKLGKISFEDLVFIPAQLQKTPVDYYKGEKIDTKTVVGRKSRQPITLATPIIVGAMSFGALNKEAKIVLAKASTLAGTCANTGEGGMVEEERAEAKHLIVQYSTGRFGISEEVLKKADAVEIKIGQGAKPGLGGFLPGFKVTQEISQVRKMPAGQDIHSPSHHGDMKDVNDLKKRVAWLRELTGGKPIILKLAAGDIENDVRLAVKAEPDVIAIDGMVGGTGAAPEVALDEIGIPSLAALVRARKVLDKMKAPQELWIGGGLNDGGDTAKALALGADAVFLGSALLLAMGAPGEEEKAQKVASFIKNCTEEMKIIAGACGKNNIHDLNRGDLTALTSEMSKIAGVKFIGLE